MKKLLLTSAAVLALAGPVLPTVSAATYSDPSVSSTAVQVNTLSVEEAIRFISEIVAQLPALDAAYYSTLATAEAADKAFNEALATEATTKAEVERLSKELAAAKADLAAKEEAFKAGQARVEAFIKAGDAKEKELADARDAKIKAAKEEEAAKIQAAQAVVKAAADAYNAAADDYNEKLALNNEAQANADLDQTEKDQYQANFDAAVRALDGAKAAYNEANNSLGVVTTEAGNAAQELIAAANAQYDLDVKNFVNTTLENDNYNQLSPAEKLNAEVQGLQDAKNAAESKAKGLETELDAAKAAAETARKAVLTGKINHQGALTAHKKANSALVNAKNKIAILSTKKGVDLNKNIQNLNDDLKKSIIDQTKKSEKQLNDESKKASDAADKSQAAYDELTANKDGETKPAETKKEEAKKEEVKADDKKEEVKAEVKKDGEMKAEAKKAEGKALPNTGETTTLGALALATLSVVAGALLVAPRFKKEN
ncbi:LPXTG cell wall anchor domain-containing protein [Aerococcaceae bacterium zg-ZJ1578]|uniref:LPXTG cell wall anchor domain-containing protein n=1 Tax=Aerococcaceae bacterium zg-252 TaxID=2796928 RepID=UPI001A21286E|nr:LPXTG cell wall anchor domain-containing protein [Aerococcaceae bacterium zg-1578]